MWILNVSLMKQTPECSSCISVCEVNPRLVCFYSLRLIINLFVQVSSLCQNSSSIQHVKQQISSGCVSGSRRPRLSGETPLKKCMCHGDLCSWLHLKTSVLCLLGHSCSQQHLGNADVPVFPKQSARGPVSGCRCFRSRRENQTACGKWSREQRGLGCS